MCCLAGNECWNLVATGQLVVYSIVLGLRGGKERGRERKGGKEGEGSERGRE